MASVIRPTVLRQTCLASCTFTSQISTAAMNKSSLIARPAVRNAFANRVAAFHATPKQAILPAGPQQIEGTANDAAHVPNPSPSHGSYHWTFERLISVGIIPLTIAPFAAGSVSPITDAALVAGMLIHSHIGFEAIVTDYIPGRELPKTRKAFDWALKLATVAVGVGLYEYETNDVGLTEGIKRIWTA